MNTPVRRSMRTFFVAVALAAVSVAAMASDRVGTDPIPGVDVKLSMKASVSSAILYGTTDEQGGCTFTDLPPGTCSLKFKVNGKKYKVSTNDAGEKIRIDSPTAETSEKKNRSATSPVVYTKSLGDVIVTVEVFGNSLRSNLNLSKSNVDRK